MCLHGTFTFTSPRWLFVKLKLAVADEHTYIIFVHMITIIIIIDPFVRHDVNPFDIFRAKVVEHIIVQTIP